jgi:protoheme IX farnesyltransferase
MVMVTAAAGFWLAGPAADQTLTLFHLLLGTALVAGGTSALNQVWERDIDKLMSRTRLRPLPSGRLEPLEASVFSWVLGLSGIGYLWAFVNAATAILAAATLISYVFMYTPLKQKTSVATLVGGVPGALPIVGGWAAVTGTTDFSAWVLFWILFLWQLPHFLALGWLYKEDYKRAGFQMLSNTDPDGRLTFLNAMVYAAALVPASLAPTLLGISGGIYFVTALVLSLWFFYATWIAFRKTSPATARKLFRVSLAYLPVLLLVMGLDRTL